MNNLTNVDYSTIQPDIFLLIVLQADEFVNILCELFLPMETKYNITIGIHNLVQWCILCTDVFGTFLSFS